MESSHPTETCTGAYSRVRQLKRRSNHTIYKLELCSFWKENFTLLYPRPGEVIEAKTRTWERRVLVLSECT